MFFLPSPLPRHFSLLSVWGLPLPFLLTFISKDPPSPYLPLSPPAFLPLHEGASSLPWFLCKSPGVCMFAQSSQISAYWEAFWFVHKTEQAWTSPFPTLPLEFQGLIAAMPLSQLLWNVSTLNLYQGQAWPKAKGDQQWLSNFSEAFFHEIWMAGAYYVSPWKEKQIVIPKWINECMLWETKDSLPWLSGNKV